MKIYTKKGDDGTTGLFGGGRLKKHHIRIESYGTVDELNSYMGYLNDLIATHNIDIELKWLQNKLFSIGSMLATPKKQQQKLKIELLQEDDILFLEQEIDKMEQFLKPLKAFILPSGHVAISTCHICRTVCRRAERRITNLNEIEEIDMLLIQYFNRLSDYLFVLARYLGHQLKVKDVEWQA